MPSDIRDYLLDRFTSDAATLRQRAAAHNSRVPGPDAATSLRMAVACDAVVELLTKLPANGTMPEMLSALQAIIPELDDRANGVGKDALVRAVFAGAATRVREVMKSESDGDGDGDGDASDDDIDDGDDAEDEDDNE